MRLFDLICREHSVEESSVMLLRHSIGSIRNIKRFDVSVEEYTSIQPIESKYDYLHPNKPAIKIVTTIVNDRVFCPYRVVEAQQSGTDFSLGSPAYRLFMEGTGREPRKCRKFTLEPLASEANGKAVKGWEKRQRVPVQRSTDSFFDEVTVQVPGTQAFSFAPSAPPDSPTTVLRQPQEETEVLQLHVEMQHLLYERLVARHGEHNVSAEQRMSSRNPADLVVTRPRGVEIYEIKTSQSPRECVKHAIGQLLEYGYWPASPDVIRLFIVGPNPIDATTHQYLRQLKNRFGIPLAYMHLPCG